MGVLANDFMPYPVWIARLPCLRRCEQRGALPSHRHWEQKAVTWLHTWQSRWGLMRLRAAAWHTCASIRPIIPMPLLTGSMNKNRVRMGRLRGQLRILFRRIACLMVRQRVLPIPSVASNHGLPAAISHQGSAVFGMSIQHRNKHGRPLSEGRSRPGEPYPPALDRCVCAEGHGESWIPCIPLKMRLSLRRGQRRIAELCLSRRASYCYDLDNRVGVGGSNAAASAHTPNA